MACMKEQVQAQFTSHASNLMHRVVVPADLHESGEKTALCLGSVGPALCVCTPGSAGQQSWWSEQWPRLGAEKPS